MIQSWWSQMVRRLQARRQTLFHVRAIQALAPGVAIYAVDVDGRRLIIGASSRTIGLLDRYPLEAVQGERDPHTSAPKEQDMPACHLTVDA